jgi:SAM-dependent methyltransferase
MAAMFANAIGYEQQMGRWSVRLAPLYVAFAQPKDAGRILDVGCGTGVLVKVIGSMTRTSEIVGVDPSQTFVDYARTQFNDPRLTFRVGDAMQLPLPSASFDHTLSLLVMMFIPEPEKAANEMRRVTRPGGTVSACTWDRDGLELSSIFWEEAVRLDPGADARSQRPKHSNREGQLTKLWQSAGLENVDETVISMQMPFVSFSDFWDPFLTGLAPQGVYVASLSEERRDALRIGLRRRLLGGGPDGPFTLQAKALAVRGTVPNRYGDT